MNAWINHQNGRVYSVYISSDLSGHLILNQVWGSIYNKKGRKKVTRVNSINEAQESIENIAKRRLNRGYVKI